MAGFVHSWLVISVVSLYSVFVCAAVPDKASILAQLKQNGACCTALDYFLPGKVHSKTLLDVQYQSSQASFWSAQEKTLLPTCIVIPNSTQDVSTAVTILSVAYQANISGCKFAVRGVGHTPQAGAANIDGGVTIDMQSMNQVTVSADQTVVSFGSGNKWGNIYPTLDNLNLAMVGGRLSPVGGISYFSGRYGFACDNIKSYELVLANGTVRTASSTSSPDLFRALKGGNNNFGIVTRFDAKLYQQTSFWGGTLTQPITNKDNVIDFISNFTVSSTYDPYAALITNFAWIPEAGTSLIIHDAEYTNGNVAWPPPTFAPLAAMPSLASTIRKDKLSSFTDELGTTNIATSGKNDIFSTLTFINKPGVTPDFMRDIYELADATSKKFLLVTGMIYTMTFQPLPHVLYTKAPAGSNALGLDRFKDDLINVLFVLSWSLPTDNDNVYRAVQDLEAAIVSKAKEQGVYNEWLYLNYAAPWADPIKAKGADTVNFLRSVSKKYDPNGVFQTAVPGGFKLWT
ncbi:oxidoreductase FAD-binding protein [Lophiotrema nucula]|uniref:Oxidoreductase FAD-binding protein n=1 Tax=Lophiotrema nucula TaxID=690887 RepID=A0A6A5YL76_9PLEO|nr:oxidoreductase FAD-binding protein [Lophiotrema nucula]